MLEWLKSVWANWRVQVTMVGGAIVVATAYGTCSYNPQEVSEAQVEPVEETTNETVPVSETTTTGTENTTTTTNVENSGETTEATTETTE